MGDSSAIWTGIAANYDRARPSPPPALLDLLTQVIDRPRPALVVDLGSGTGLSTVVRAERAERVIGIEPNADMRDEALRKLASLPHPNAAHIEDRERTAQQTGLPDGWMCGYPDTPRGLKPHGFSGKPSYPLIIQERGFAPEGGAPAQWTANSIAAWHG
jgi:hypothetical protein